MAKFYECPDCGCSLDFGEKCDCLSERARQEEKFRRIMYMDHKGQMTMDFGKEERRYEKAIAV